jgi:hypothetical protein
MCRKKSIPEHLLFLSTTKALSSFRPSVRYKEGPIKKGFHSIWSKACKIDTFSFNGWTSLVKSARERRWVTSFSYNSPSGPLALSQKVVPVVVPVFVPLSSFQTLRYLGMINPTDLLPGNEKSKTRKVRRRAFLLRN